MDSEAGTGQHWPTFLTADDDDDDDDDVTKQ
jgi:hypothetical protein